MIEIHCYIYMISVRFISIVSLLYEIIKSVSDIKRFCFIIICHAYHSDEQSILFFFFFFFQSLPACNNSFISCRSNPPNILNSFKLHT
jgi:hypothetical protein